jgi:hypothetical protein
MRRKNIDDEIREALSAEDARLLEEFDEEPSLVELTIKSMTSRFRLTNVMGAVVMVIFMVLGLFSVWQFFQATELKALISWSLSIMFCVTTIGLMKIWYWMLIIRYDATREIKRLELQVARLAQQRKSA